MRGFNEHYQTSRLPKSLHEQLGALARREGVSINQLINSAVAEKMSALMTKEYLEERAERGSREGFDRVLSKVEESGPGPGDEIT